MLLLGGLLTLCLPALGPWPGIFPGVLAALLFLGTAAAGGGEKHIEAGIRTHASTGTAIFTMRLDKETVALDPGKTWVQVDHFKWVVRGLIEEPQSFHVFPDGSVEINAEKISIADPEGVAKLDHQINKHHAPLTAPRPVASPVVAQPAAASPQPARPRFRVKLDHWGHMIIEWGEGLEREETGLRGFATLVANGLVRKPRTFRVDALQRGIEIEEDWFECSDAGASRLEEALNHRYAPEARAARAGAIEVKENAAASTGFDVHFAIHRAGVPLELRGHLSQENLDLLQDPTKCDLIQPGIHLLLSPPYLLFRRRRPDMGEEKIPELPDVNLLRTNAAQLQHVLNHPLIRKGIVAGGPAPPIAGDLPEQLVELRVVRHPADKALLWLEGATNTGRPHDAKAFTHHNVAELQHGGVFRPYLDVCLSLDHRRLSVLNRESKAEEAITLDPATPDEDLHRASLMLTRALRPLKTVPIVKPATPAVAIASSARPAAAASSVPAVSMIRSETHPPRPQRISLPFARATTKPAGPAAETPPLAASNLPPVAIKSGQLSIATLFTEADAARVNVETFRRLGVWLGIPVQEVSLSLPRVFENRRFEVLSFEPMEIQSLMDLRGEDFYGFYLSHVSERKIVLVYACNGMHLEWGPDKCVVQPTARSEAEEFVGDALLGLAQNRSDEFVFVVKPAFKEWIVPREQTYTVENLRFLTVADVAAAPADYRLIWPLSPATGA